MCSTIILGSGASRVLAGNYDYALGHGLVATSVRGAHKENARQAGQQAVAWDVRYGSVTFNSFALELPTAGMNEVGLCLALMWHDEGRFGFDDSLPRFNPLQWIQYQLDSHASVEELVDSLETAQPRDDGVPLHYTALDSRGDCALVEFVDGEPVVTRDPAFPALTNSSYARCIEAAAADERLDEHASKTSLGRFATLHRLYRSTPEVDTAEALALLGAVEQAGDTSEAFPWGRADLQTRTVWSYVFCPAAGTIAWTTDENRDLRELRLGNLDLGEGSRYQTMDVHAGAGDATWQLAPYHRDDNQRIVRESARLSGLTARQQQELVDIVDGFYRTGVMRF